MAKPDGLYKLSIISILGTLATCAALSMGSRPSFSQLAQQQPPQSAAPAQQQSTTPSPQTASPSSGQSASPVGKEREIKESKEIKEIKDHPSDFVGLANALAWPLSLVTMLLIVLVGIGRSDTIKELFGITTSALRRINIGGIELEINPEAMGRVKEFLGKSFDELVTKAKEEYDRMASTQLIDHHLTQTSRIALRAVLKRHSLNESPANVRATIHVPDIVFKHYLYQLVDYFPSPDAGGRAGRRFSQRYGIIGRSWRLGKSMGRGRAVAAEIELIERWGMLANEASNQSHLRPADLCIILRNQEEDNTPVGLLFIDSTVQDAFGVNPDGEKTGHLSADRIARELEAEPETKALTRAVARAMAPLRLAAPGLEITRTLR